MQGPCTMQPHSLSLAFNSPSIDRNAADSASSVVISRGDHGEAASAESSASALKEHDYIGLSEVSSSSSASVSRQDAEDLEETDLCLGLGLGSSRHRAALKLKEAPVLSLSEQGLKISSDAPVPSCRNGTKRLFSEAMSEVSRGDAVDSKQPLAVKDPQGLFRTAQSVPHFGRTALQMPAGKAVGMAAAKSAEGSGAPWSSAVVYPSFNEASKHTTFPQHQDDGSTEPPPAKDRVVGWPPVRSYRKNLVVHPQTVGGDEEDSQSTIYVKVNMDGNPIGRKVDLNAFSSYESLVSALEEMFQAPGHGVRFLRNSDSILTYEDQEGDWMLVGDVPWSMFVNTVRRLRIVRGTEASRLLPRVQKFHV